VGHTLSLQDENTQDVSNEWGWDKPGTRIFAENGHEEPSTPKWNAREDEHRPVEPGARQSTSR